jgi:hypothetical protein
VNVNKTTGLCNPFVDSGSVNILTTIEGLLEAVFSVGSALRLCGEGNSVE